MKYINDITDKPRTEFYDTMSHVGDWCTNTHHISSTENCMMNQQKRQLLLFIFIIIY